MAPNKLDNQFREGFENHEIQPSPAAWDRLDAMLTVAEKPKKRFHLMPIAASIIGFFIIVTVLVWQSKTVINQDNQNGVVISYPTEKPITEPKNEVVVQENKNQKTAIVSQTKEVIKSSNQKTMLSKSIANNQVQKQEKNGVQSSSQSTIINQNEAYGKNPQNVNVVATTGTQPQKAKYLDAAALLAEVDNKNTTAKTTINLKQSSYKVNAKTLLTQVDGELEQTFRQNVFQRINANYQAVKVAIADRNNQ